MKFLGKSIKRNAETIVFTFTDKNIVLFTATAKSITVDWGDGKTDKYDDLDSTDVSHGYYTDYAKFTVRVQTENLSVFICREQQLIALDVSNCPTLTALDCSCNRLSALDVSKNTALTYLQYSGNPRLSALDVSKNTKLISLDCENNQLSVAALNRIFTDLPDRSGMKEGYIAIGYNPGTDTCDQSIATKKNWNVN